MDADTTVVEYHRPNLVRLGAHKVAHLDEPLMNHLARTYRILRDMGCEPSVCLAGLFHGSYGTEGLHTDEIGDIPETRRAIVRESVGNEVERLVYHFSIMSYESLSKSFRNLLKPGGEPDLRDRRSGEPIPMSRDHFHGLLALKLADVLAHTPTQSHHSCLNLPEEYGMFWEMVADYLGDDYLAVWNAGAVG